MTRISERSRTPEDAARRRAEEAGQRAAEARERARTAGERAEELHAGLPAVPEEAGEDER